jgi:hypothetical protein
MTFIIPPMQKLSYNWKILHDHKVGVMYQPSISNMESGNAFCLIQVDNELVLVVFQITVGKAHLVKKNGLKDIVQSFSVDIKTKIKRKLFVFATPVQGKLTKIQPIHNKDCKVMAAASILNDARDFEQWVYRHFIKFP